MKTITDFENENYFTPKTANRIAGEVGVEIPAAVKAEIEEMESTKPDFKVWELSERTDEDCDKLYAAIEEGCFDPEAEFAFYDYGKIKKFNTNNI